MHGEDHSLGKNTDFFFHMKTFFLTFININLIIRDYELVFASNYGA